LNSFPSQCSVRPGKRELITRDGAPALAGKRVLVAEDDPSARRAITSALRAMGLEVIETHDGGRMLVAVTGYYKGGHAPEDLDLIVTDAHMPVVDGLEVFWALRAAHWTIPVIIVTGHDTAEIHDAATRLDAILLPKPLDLDLLESAVRKLLARSAATRAWGAPTPMASSARISHDRVVGSQEASP
jgi:DNA-binding response OmpR family regulator